MSRAFPPGPAALSALLARHGLAFVSGWHSGFLVNREVAEELEAVRGHATLLRETGVSVLVHGEMRLHGRRRPRRAARRSPAA
jgi:inosose dehydratase